MSREIENLSEDLAAYLVENDIAEAIGTDIFICHLPDNDSGIDAILIDETGGIPDPELPVENPTRQILVRNSDHATAKSKIYAIYNLLNRANDSLVLKEGGVDVMYIEALQMPTSLGLDNNERSVYSVNFMFKLRKND